MKFIVTAFLLASVADFLSGLVHWLEDSYGQEDWPIVGQSVIAPNLLHHKHPRAFLENSWWGSADYQIFASLFILLIAAWLGRYSWELVFLLVITVNGNEVHKWSHRTRKENSAVITCLQNWRIVQTRCHHAHHHRDRRDSHYCTITNWVNPILDKFKLWRFLELCVFTCSGTMPRDN
jgi:hypothetical protein